MPTKEEKMLAEKLIQRESLIATRDAVEKFIKGFDAQRDEFQIQVRIETLDRVNHAFLEVQDMIERLDSEDLKEHLVERVDFEHRYCMAKGFLLSKRPVDANQAQLNNSLAAPPATFHLRLPQIDLPRFNGDFSRWLSFRDTFSSMVHSNADIPTVAKLQYLLQSLEGDAKKPFESVDIEADNYASTWDALIKRYDNRRFLKRQLFRALYDLPAVKQESAKLIHNLVDDFQRHVRALAKLNEPVDHWDTPLVNMLSYKLDPSTLRAWEEKTSEKDDVKYGELVEFLYQRVRVLNSVGYDQQHQPAPAKVAGSAPKPSKFKFAANAAASSNSSSSCPLRCSDNHFLRNCPVFLGKDVRHRQEFVTQKRLCWNCLCKGHQAKECFSKFTCQTCHERHHSLLHDSASSETPLSSAVSSSAPTQQSLPSTSVGSSSANSAPPNVSMAVRTACNMVLLETVVLNIVDDHGRKHQARALLDSASMSNFISKPLAKRLFNSRSKVDVSIAGIGRSTQNVKGAITTTVQSRTQQFSKKLEFLILKNPSAELPTIPINISSWNFPDATLADPRFHVPGRIDLVIGSEAFWELHTGRKILLGNDLPWLTETPFGWTVTGNTSSQPICTPRICNLSTGTRLKYCKMEAISDGPTMSVVDNCEQKDATIPSRNLSERYDVSLPRSDNPGIVLGSSQEIEDQCLQGFKQPLGRDPATKDTRYHIMGEYLNLGDSLPPCFQHITDVNYCNAIASVDSPADDMLRSQNPVNLPSLAPEPWPSCNQPEEETATVDEIRKLHHFTLFCLRYIGSSRELVSLRRFDPGKYTIIGIQKKPIPPLTVKLQRAELRLCHRAQQQSAAEETSNRSNVEGFTKSSKLKWLKPFIDQDNILRVGGRLQNAELADYVKYPIVLSAKHPLLQLLTSCFHSKLLHAGSQLLLAILRQKFWILGGRNFSKSVFHHCHTCFRSKPTLVQQSTADLLASRVSPTRPLSVCGVDYCGASLLKPSVCTCSATKACVRLLRNFAAKCISMSSSPEGIPNTSSNCSLVSSMAAILLSPWKSTASLTSSRITFLQPAGHSEELRSYIKARMVSSGLLYGSRRLVQILFVRQQGSLSDHHCIQLVKIQVEQPERENLLEAHPRLVQVIEFPIPLSFVVRSTWSFSLFHVYDARIHDGIDHHLLHRSSTHIRYAEVTMDN